MQTTLLTIPVQQISDWESFHDVFARVMGFPADYGRNMDAWIDCMTHLDDAEAGMTTSPIQPGGLVALRIDDADNLQRRCPSQYDALLECAAFVNFRRIEAGEPPLLTLMLSGHFQDG